MPAYSVHVWRPDGNTEQYGSIHTNTPLEAAQVAARRYEEHVVSVIKKSDGRSRRQWEGLLVPRQLEVWDDRHRKVATFTPAQLAK